MCILPCLYVSGPVLNCSIVEYSNVFCIFYIVYSLGTLMFRFQCFKQQANHTADADSPAPAARLRQTTLESLLGRRLDNNSDS